MTLLRLVLACVFIAALVTCASAQQPTGQPCSDNPDNGSCPPNLNLGSGEFQATPLIDAVCTNGVCPDYGDPDHNKVSLYGSYGNAETSGNASLHSTQGTNLTQNIMPRCKDGSVPPPNTNCQPGNYAPAIVFLFLGFSNCDLEVCGGNSDAWDRKDLNPNNPNGHLKGQPCATQCPNLHNPDPNFPNAWNQVTSNGGDTVTQQSFLYQVYHDPLNQLVGPHVVVFDGALGQQTLDKWDPTPFGHYANNADCMYGTNSLNPECNYDRVRHDLANNGYSEAQVQAIFFKASTSFPQCDLKGLYCAAGAMPDAYLSEIYLGNILRYLKCCELDANGQSTGLPRYPNLQQVFLTSRTYGGYANGTAHGCLSPEPFAYEEGFAVQRAIVAQINQSPGYPPIEYAGDLSYDVAPWVDWGPYLWISGETQRQADQLVWCNGQNDQTCQGKRDVRFGDLSPGYEAYWGDFTHPAAGGLKKVADQLVTFIGKTQGKSGSPFVTPWIGQ